MKESELDSTQDLLDSTIEIVDSVIQDSSEDEVFFGNKSSKEEKGQKSRYTYINITCYFFVLFSKAFRCVVL